MEGAEAWEKLDEERRGSGNRVADVAEGKRGTTMMMMMMMMTTR